MFLSRQGRREGLLLEPRRRGAVQGGGADGGAILARAAGRVVSHPGVRARERNIAKWLNFMYVSCRHQAM